MLGRAKVHEPVWDTKGAFVMVGVVGLHGADDAQVIDDAADEREQIAEPRCHSGRRGEKVQPGALRKRRNCPRRPCQLSTVIERPPSAIRRGLKSKVSTW